MTLIVHKFSLYKTVTVETTKVQIRVQGPSKTKGLAASTAQRVYVSGSVLRRDAVPLRGAAKNQRAPRRYVC